MKRLLALVVKEFLQLKRDRISLRMMVMIPLMQTFIFGYAINYDVKHLKTVVLDESRSFDSRELVAKMTATEYFDVIGSVNYLIEANKDRIPPDQLDAQRELLINKMLWGHCRNQAGMPRRQANNSQGRLVPS